MSQFVKFFNILQGLDVDHLGSIVPWSATRGNRISLRAFDHACLYLLGILLVGFQIDHVSCRLVKWARNKCDFKGVSCSNLEMLSVRAWMLDCQGFRSRPRCICKARDGARVFNKILWHNLSDLPRFNNLKAICKLIHLIASDNWSKQAASIGQRSEQLKICKNSGLFVRVHQTSISTLLISSSSEHDRPFWLPIAIAP